MENVFAFSKGGMVVCMVISKADIDIVLNDVNCLIISSYIRGTNYGFDLIETMRTWFCNTLCFEL